jgi:hypothetical protein
VSVPSVRLEPFACFKQCFEARENVWAAIGTGGVTWIVFRPLVMRDGNLRGLTLRHEFYRDA